MGLLVADCETFGTDPKNGKLLGIAICDMESLKTCYITLQWYNYHNSSWTVSPNYDLEIDLIRTTLSSAVLVGHNHSYDKSWIDYTLGIDTRWHACTRLMWHMASAPTGPRGYGLKDAQVELLGYKEKGNTTLNEQIKARGGKPGADIYLADREVIAKYAELDALSTAQLYNHLKPFFDQHDYWWMLEKMVEYSWLIQKCTEAGIAVDVPALEQQMSILHDTKGAYSSQFIELAKSNIDRLERVWRDDRASKYTIEEAKNRFLANWSMQKKFNISSDKDKQELLYTVMKLPVVVETEGGKPSTGVEAVKLAVEASKDKEAYKELVEAYEQSESSETLLNSFAKPWHGATNNGRLHPRFNPCGTVSYRLSGYKPYLLNAPFDEQGLMSCLKCDEGWVGVHADFVSVEPAVTAHYSQDPHLLKVFREGLGDVYLDLALTLFPDDKELKAGYNPSVPVTKEVKDRFKKQRQVAKVIQLAVQYTGTKYTISKNLTYAGHPTSLAEADFLVQAYWKHFHKVKVMNETLFMRFEKQGYLRNAVGRIIRVPTHINIKRKDGSIWEKPLPRYKDLPNRFIQSSAHDLLSFWVLGIASRVKELGLKAKPVIIDCHDSTSWQCPKEEVGALEEVFGQVLTQLNKDVRMSVPVKIEMKRFTTLAGLKGDE